MIAQWSNKHAFKKYISARDDYLQGRYKLAIDKLLSLDVITKNDDVNHLLVECLYHQKAYSDAEQVLLADVNSYTSSELLMQLMVKVLLKNHEYIICREVVASINDSDVKDNFLRQIKKCELKIGQNSPVKIRHAAKRFYHLSDYSLIKQRMVFRRSQRLPLRTFMMISKDLLIDPFLKPIMRLSILDSIRKMGLNVKLRYRWIDHQIYLIDLNNVSNLTDTRSYQQVMKIIDANYYHNPAWMLALKRNLRLDLSYLYPFNDQKVNSPKLWVKVAALRLQGQQPIFKNDQIKSIYHLQVRLNQFTKNLAK